MGANNSGTNGHGMNMDHNSAPNSAEGNWMEENRRVLGWVAELLNGNSRETALMELSKKREQVPELALIIWHSFGRFPSVIEPKMATDLTIRCHDFSAPRDHLRVSSAQPVTTDSRSLKPGVQCSCAASVRSFAQRDPWALPQWYAHAVSTQARVPADSVLAHIPLFLYPFLNTTSKSRPFEYLRLTSLGVIGALVKNDSSEVINFLLTTEIIPLCLRIMETGSELSKTVAIFIVQKILLDDTGLGYICHTYERFYAVGTVLSNMVTQLVEQQTVRLLKHVVRCFLRWVLPITDWNGIAAETSARLSDNARAREALRQCLPEPLRDATFSSVLRDDAATKRCLAQLLINLSDNVVESSNSQGM